MNTDFHSFLDKKGRDAKKQLHIVKEILTRSGLKVHDFLGGDGDPYIFVNNTEASDFGGVRVYKTGDMIAYRVQKEAKTYPYGRTYALKIPDMFQDLVSDKYKEEEAGKKVIEGVVREIRKFFEASAKAERDLQTKQFHSPGDNTGRVLIASNATDYLNPFQA